MTKSESEAYVAKLCRNTFLSLWSYPNPRGKDAGKELCDILVVCEPDVVIISVKEIALPNTGKIETDWQRWHRKAIEESARQIYGAERYLATSAQVVTAAGQTALPLPDVSRRRIHRVAVAFGSQGKAPITFGDLGKGFVHVFDEVSLDIVLGELDTISDFVQYLRDKEDLYARGVQTLFSGGEEDLLALYLRQQRSFPTSYNVFAIDDTLWDGLKSRPEYLRKRQADKASYLWDALIEGFTNDLMPDALSGRGSLTDLETVLRVMAREDRFQRRMLGQTFGEFLGLSQQAALSRLVKSSSGVTYVFLTHPHGADRERRVDELQQRCLVARGLDPAHGIVIGIATEQYDPDRGHSLDAIYLPQQDPWSEEDQELVNELQARFGHYLAPRRSVRHIDEYPQS